MALYGLGALAAVRRGHPFDVASFLLGQLAVSSIQLMTHYANDYFDFDADRANRTPTRWSGGSRVLVNGELPRGVALHAAIVVGAVAPVALVCLVLSARRFPAEAIVLMALMQALAWFYSAPPLRLHSRGLGEATTALVVPVLTPVSAFVIQAGELEWFPIALAVPLAFLQFVMLLSIEFPDHAGDRAVGKRNLVVLLGPNAAARLATALVVSAYVAVAAVIAGGAPTRLAWTWLALAPLAALHVARLVRGDFRRPSAWGALAFGAVALYFLAIVAELVALV